MLLPFVWWALEDSLARSHVTAFRVCVSDFITTQNAPASARSRSNWTGLRPVSSRLSLSSKYKSQNNNCHSGFYGGAGSPDSIILLILKHKNI